MGGVSGDNGAERTSTTNCDLRIAPSPPLLLMAEMGGSPTKPNADDTNDTPAAMSPQVLEYLGR